MFRFRGSSFLVFYLVHGMFGFKLLVGTKLFAM